MILPYEQTIKGNAKTKTQKGNKMLIASGNVLFGFATCPANIPKDP